MPLGSSAVFDKVAKTLGRAAEMANPDGDPDPDLEMPLSQLKAAKWGTHSFRRLSDALRRRYLETHEVVRGAEMHNAQMGWREAEAKRDMSVQYDVATVQRRADAADMVTEI